jgi:NADP-dependent 3-hydroxy acid dehydrogenase YdfG
MGNGVIIPNAMVAMEESQVVRDLGRDSSRGASFTDDVSRPTMNHITEHISFKLTRKRSMDIVETSVSPVRPVAVSGVV